MQLLRELIHPPFRIVYRRNHLRVRIVGVWRRERLLRLPTSAKTQESPRLTIACPRPARPRSGAIRFLNGTGHSPQADGSTAAASRARSPCPKRVGPPLQYWSSLRVSRRFPGGAKRAAKLRLGFGGTSPVLRAKTRVHEVRLAPAQVSRV